MPHWAFLLPVESIEVPELENYHELDYLEDTAPILSLQMHEPLRFA